MASLISIRIACYCPHPPPTAPPLTLLPIGYASATSAAVQSHRMDRQQSFNTLYLPYLLIMPLSLFYCFLNPHNSFLQWNYVFKSQHVDTVRVLFLFLWRLTAKTRAKKATAVWMKNRSKGADWEGGGYNYSKGVMVTLFGIYAKGVTWPVHLK